MHNIDVMFIVFFAATTYLPQGTVGVGVSFSPSTESEAGASKVGSEVKMPSSCFGEAALATGAEAGGRTAQAAVAPGNGK